MATNFSPDLRALAPDSRRRNRCTPAAQRAGATRPLSHGQNCTVIGDFDESAYPPAMPKLLSLRTLLAYLVGLTLIAASGPLSIDAFGAIPNNDTLLAARANGKALFFALAAANTGSPTAGNRSVVVPSGSNYTLLPYGVISNLSDVTLRLDGNIIAWDEQRTYPNDTHGVSLNLIHITHCARVSLEGEGIVEGRGDPWWVTVWETGVDNRPHLLVMEVCRDVSLTGWTLRNSPQYHVLLEDMLNLWVERVIIYVDVEGQREGLRAAGRLSDGTGYLSGTTAAAAARAGQASSNKIATSSSVKSNTGFASAVHHDAAASRTSHSNRGAGLLPAGVPTFPLNTDGIDVSGHNITVRNCTVTNFDDTVSV